MPSSIPNRLLGLSSSWLQPVLLLLLLGLVGIVGLNLLAPYLWYDEAVQFWVSLGLTPDSPPFSTPEGLASVFESNRYYNLDPGGFGFLLHAWTYFTHDATGMRLLPFFFFLLSIGVCMYMAWHLTQQKTWTILGGFIPFLVPVWIHLSVEIRAYSMEALGSLLCIAALLHLQQKISVKRLLCWSLVFCFFITSRYTEIIIVATTSLYVLYLIAQHTRGIKPFLVLATLYAIPLFIVVLLIYVTTMRIQNADANSLSYLPYLSKKLSMLWDKNNIVFNLIYGIHGVLFLFSFFYKPLRTLRPLFFMAFASNTVIIILSIMGFHPWSSIHSRCLSLFVIQTTCTVLVLIALSTKRFNRYSAWVCLLAAVSIVLFVFNNRERAFKRYYNKKNIYYVFKQQPLSPNLSIYADYYEVPYIKYLFEYGQPALQKKINYPSQFTLAQCTRHGFTEGSHSPYFSYIETQPYMNELLAYDWLITPRLFSKGQNDAWMLMPGATSVWVKKGKEEKDDE